MSAAMDALRQRKVNTNQNHKIDNNYEVLNNTPQHRFNSFKATIIKLLKRLFYLVLIILVFIYILCPLIFYYSLTVRRMLIFMNYVNIPFYKNLSDPMGHFGLNCTRGLRVESENDIDLGVWHVLPHSRASVCDGNRFIDSEMAFNDERPIILYLHGNGGARGGEHRRKLYRVLSASDVDAHVIAFDYRGYGDSTDVWPTATGIANDAQSVYYWLISQQHVDRSRVIVWGHSLGTAVSIKFVSQLTVDSNPSGIVLEAPFTSIADAILFHPFGVVHRYMPLFNSLFVKPITANELTNFDSISLLNQIKCPILILHAMDDRIVPFHLGHKLYENSLKLQQSSHKKAQMIAFNGKHGYGHKDIYRDPELPKIINNYIKSINE